MRLVFLGTLLLLQYERCHRYPRLLPHLLPHQDVARAQVQVTRATLLRDQLAAAKERLKAQDEAHKIELAAMRSAVGVGSFGVVCGRRACGDGSGGNPVISNVFVTTSLRVK